MVNIVFSINEEKHPGEYGCQYVHENMIEQEQVFVILHVVVPFVRVALGFMTSG
jgi:hypothetical protein